MTYFLCFLSSFFSSSSNSNFSQTQKKPKKSKKILRPNQTNEIKKTLLSTNFANNDNNKLSRMGEILLNNQPNDQLNKDDNEEAELVRQISVNPRSPESYRRLGDFYVENDRLRDARECYKYVLRLDPRHKRAQLAMRRLDRILG